ncbi:MAG TPA: efflux RND transporter periplasmic adaptor subunit [Daejeonella sp.]|nr:efflux RND transporter periplasmic adaptor subunit [Daejeonella sp.]
MNFYKKTPISKGALLIFCAFAGSLGACTSKSATPKKEEKFVVTDTLLKSLLIDTVRQANANAEITLTGKIAPDEDKMVKIYPMVSGIVRDVHVQLGDVVKKEQLLASLKSMEIAGFAKDAIASDADIRNTQRNLQVTQDLYKSGMASEKELEEAKSEHQKALAEGKRAHAVMQLNGNSNTGYLIKSPISGFVVEKNLTNNMHVRPDNAENLFTIADLSTVWALVNVYESDISRIHTGDEVRITTLSYPDRVFAGKIDKIYSMLDPENKVMRARVKINNPDNLLKPEMFASVQVKALSGENQPVISTRSLIFDKDQNFVLVVDSNKKVRIQPVEIAKKVGEQAYVKAGLKDGDRIIASRQVFLYESLKD